MTNQEAIRFGKCILMVADDKSDGTTIEFTKLALKALEQGDVLREIRQEITDLNRYQFSGFGIDAYLNAGEVYKIIDTKIKELSE